MSTPKEALLPVGGSPLPLGMESSGSISTTLCPWLLSCHAMVLPMMPAPITAMVFVRGVALEPFCSNYHDA